MSRYLFVVWEGGGTTPPELAIAGRLVRRGHEVTVLGDPCLASDVASVSARFLPYTRAPYRATRDPGTEIIRDWGALTPLGAFARARDRHAFVPAGLFAAEVRDALRAHTVDALAVDAMLYGALVGAEASGLPFAALMPNTSYLPGHGRPPPALGLRPARTAWGRLRDRVLLGLGDRVLWAGCTPWLNRARAAHGLAPVTHPHQQVLRADRVLVLTSATFDFDAPRSHGPVRYVGPELSDPVWSQGTRDSESTGWPVGDGARVLVALSSTYQRQEALLQRLLDALGGLPVRAVATLGPGLTGRRFHVPTSVRLLDAAPHGTLLPAADLCVTHGGHGTVIRALAHGVPLVVLPMGRDQGDNAVRVDAVGAGITASSRSGVERLRGVIGRALADSALRAGALRMRAVIAEECRDDRAVAELEALAMGPRVECRAE